MQKSFLKYHTQQIQNLCDNGELIDGFIMLYCGHGEDGNNLVLSNCKLFSILILESKFENEVDFDCLLKLPKIFIYDCCRGQDTKVSPQRNL